MPPSRFACSIPSGWSFAAATVLAVASLPVLLGLAKWFGAVLLTALLTVLFGPFVIFVLAAGLLHRRRFIFYAEINRLTIEDRSLLVRCRSPRQVPISSISGWKFIEADDEDGGTVEIEIAEKERFEVCGCSWGGKKRSGFDQIEQLIARARSQAVRTREPSIEHRLSNF